MTIASLQRQNEALRLMIKTVSDATDDEAAKKTLASLMQTADDTIQHITKHRQGMDHLASLIEHGTVTVHKMTLGVPEDQKNGAAEDESSIIQNYSFGAGVQQMTDADIEGKIKKAESDPRFKDWMGGLQSSATILGKDVRNYPAKYRALRLQTPREPRSAFERLLQCVEVPMQAHTSSLRHVRHDCPDLSALSRIL